MHVGCHISTRNGYVGAARTAAHIGAKSFQYFPKNPRGLSLKAYNRQDAEACADFCREHGIRSIAHTSYMTNLASTGQLRQPTIDSVRNELEIADACGSDGLVVHFGKFKEIDPLVGYRNIISMLNEILDGWEGKALLLVENQAGESGGVGMTLEELTQIRQLTARPEFIGFCLDTCHIFASGVWNGGNGDELREKGERLGYFQHLRAVHLNDSVYESGSRRDRHANIGKGHIGDEGFRGLWVPRPLLAGIPLVLETPVLRGYTHEQEITHVAGLLFG